MKLEAYLRAPAMRSAASVRIMDWRGDMIVELLRDQAIKEYGDRHVWRVKKKGAVLEARLVEEDERTDPANEP